MTPLFKKLNFKAHEEVLLINAPDSFQVEVEAMAAFTHFATSAAQLKKVHFALIFVKTLDEIEKSIAEVHPLMEGDAILWFAYPKASSKKYICSFNRDTGWQALGSLGYEGVRQVAIDEDWSALRFRKVEYIKKITRSASMAMTPQAKARTKGKQSL